MLSPLFCLFHKLDLELGAWTCGEWRGYDLLSDICALRTFVRLRERRNTVEKKMEKKDCRGTSSSFIDLDYLHESERSICRNPFHIPMKSVVV